MAEFKCKTCVALLQIEKGMTVIECSYCHVKQTLPKLDDEHYTPAVKYADDY